MKAPEIKHYINWLGRVEYRNINCSFTYDETSYAAIDRIFRLLHRLDQARRTQAGNYGSVRSEVPLKTSAALRSCGRTARWRALRSLKPGGIPSSRRRQRGSTLPPARSEDRVSGNILGASACAGGGQPQRARLPL